MIVLRFSGGRSPAARLIQAATWSWASHVDLELRNGQVLGASPEGGVDIRDPAPVMRVERYGVLAPREVWDFAADQIGKPYDWAGVLGWGMHRDWQEPDAWFCSELIAWAFQQARRPLLRADDAWRITPRDLLLSPFLIPLDGRERSLPDGEAAVRAIW